MIVIIGNGISGVTAARNIRKRSDEPITIISAESKYFFSRTALMYVYMGHMKFEHTQPYEPHFWTKNRIELLQDFVEHVDTSSNEVHLRNGVRLTYSQLIIASGSKPNKFGWPGQDADGVSGLYSKQDLEYIEERSPNMKTAVIVGGGLIGIELAEMLLSRNIEVHFLIREEYFFNGLFPTHTSEMLMKHFEKHHGLHMHYSTELEEIQTNNENKVTGVKTKTGKQIECQFVGLTVGVTPNIEFIKSSGIEINRGVLVNEFLETSAKGVYAIGDCAELKSPTPGRRPIEQVWYPGKFMGETVAKTITGEPTKYNPGHWFNSAKFFEIEYQTYGMVHNELQDGQDEFVYQHTEDEVLLHFVFEKESRKFVGVNNFGIRLRHPVFNDWLLKESTIEDVLTNLRSANFDPEFYKKYEQEVVERFNTKFGAKVQLEKTKWWKQLINS
jgi:NAD(P)H-nitrite reductase large subunit